MRRERRGLNVFLAPFSGTIAPPEDGGFFLSVDTVPCLPRQSWHRLPWSTWIILSGLPSNRAFWMEGACRKSGDRKRQEMHFLSAGHRGRMPQFRDCGHGEGIRQFPGFLGLLPGVPIRGWLALYVTEGMRILTLDSSVLKCRGG